MGCALHQFHVPVFNCACIANRNIYNYFSSIAKHNSRSMKTVVDEL